MLGSDDVLACFIAGNAFTWDDWFRLETMDDSLQPTIDMLLNVAIFMWFGAVCPWHQFVANDVIPIYRLIPLGILVLLLRRLPMVLAFHKGIHQIEDIRNALFVGFFGPIGVSAIFYLYISREFLREIHGPDGAEREDAVRLMEIMNVVIWFLTVCSIFVHGLSIPLGKLGFYLPRTISTAISSERPSASQSMARTENGSESRLPAVGILDTRSLMRPFRRRLTTSERGEVPDTVGWIPKSIARVGKHILSDLTRPAGGKNEQSDGAHDPEAGKDHGDSSSSSSPPRGHEGAHPEISAPRDPRLIGHAINNPPVAVNRTEEDDEADGPRVSARSPVSSPAISRIGSPVRGAMEASSSLHVPAVGWQRSIRFGDEAPRGETERTDERSGE